MSVCGLDYGNSSLLIGQAGKGGVDVILNESSNRQTATYVSIQGKQRFLGDAAAAMSKSNINNTVSSLKLLVGRRFEDPAVQKELSKATFRACKMQSGNVGVYIMYDGKETVVSVEHLMAMMLVKAKDIANKANNGINLADAVLAVPNWYTESQRRGVLSACEIASLNCLKVVNEAAMVALSYGIFKSAKKLFSETEPAHIMFIDIGYTCYTVTIVDFIQENMTVLSTVCDREFGGRDFDDIIVEFLAETFQTKFGIDVRKNKKAILKLQAAAEKAKKTLSPAGVNEVSVSVECVADDKDLNVYLTREVLETRAADLIARLEAPIMQALAEAKLTKEQISETEIVGGCTRVNIIKKRLGEILGLDSTAMHYGLKTTMNSDEAVARGTALQCAMVSSRIKVKPFNITDTLYYGITANFEMTSSAASEESKEDIGVKGTSALLYSRGAPFPHKPRRITFPKKSSSFTVSLTYDEASTPLLPAGEFKSITTFNVIIPPEFVASGAKDVRVTFNLDKNSLAYIQSAEILEEIMVPEEPLPVPPSEGKEGEATAEPVMKKKLHKTELKVVSESFGITKDEIKGCIELEAQMQLEDRIIIETAERRNELESYIYSMRDKIDHAYKSFATADESNHLKSLMETTEDWLYNDGFDTVKSEYVKRLDDLRSISNKVEYRFNEEEQRQPAINALKSQIDLCKKFASTYDDAHSHIEEDERDKIRSEAKDAESWVFDMQSKQGELAQSADPVLTTDGISKRRNALFLATNPIIIKKKPAPAPETKEEAKDETKDKAKDESKEEDDPKNDEPTPMDV